MRYIEKTNQSLIFNQWKEENAAIIQTWVENTEKTGDNLWGELGKTFSVEKETEIDPSVLRQSLETALFEEQHGLCCYCGNIIERTKDAERDIWVYHHRAIEHFEPKNRVEFKAKTFDYSNLMLCCKESQRLISFEIGRTYNGSLIQNFEDVAKYVKLPQSIIREHPKNEAIMKQPLKNGDKIYVPNPPHCDDAKSEFDSKREHTKIINPSKDKEQIEKLLFYANGRIDYLERETVENTLIENTFKALSLNCTTLVERRQDKWLNSYINYNDVILPYWIEEITEIGFEDELTAKNIIANNVNKLIEGKALPNSENLLEPFYFVEIAFLKSLFNANV